MLFAKKKGREKKSYDPALWTLGEYNRCKQESRDPWLAAGLDRSDPADAERIRFLEERDILPGDLFALQKVFFNEYMAHSDAELREAIEALARGMVLGDGLACLPAGLEPLGDGSECLVTLREGKYHQVKRMLAARGKPVRYLKRLSMGPIRLDPALGPGEWRPLTREEVAALRRGQ